MNAFASVGSLLARSVWSRWNRIVTLLLAVSCAAALKAQDAVEIWIPEKSVSYSVPAATVQVLVPASTTEVWNPPVEIPFWVPYYVSPLWHDGYYDWRYYEGYMFDDVWFDGGYEWGWFDGFWYDGIFGGYWDVEIEPGFSSTVTIPEHYEDRFIDAHNDTLTSPAHNEAVTLTPGGLVRDGGRLIPNTAWVYSYLTDDNWTMEDDDDRMADSIFSSFAETEVATEVLRSGDPVKVLPRIRPVADGIKPIRVPNGVSAAIFLELARIALDEWVEAESLARAINKMEEAKRLLVSFVTYEKVNTKTNPHQVYSGRTYGAGTAAMVLARRDAKHRVEKRDFDAAIANSYVTTIGFSNWGWTAHVGREQQQIDWHRGQNHWWVNIYNGVSPYNKDAYTFWLTSTVTHGFLAPFMGTATSGQIVTPDAPVWEGPWSQNPLTP